MGVVIEDDNGMRLAGQHRYLGIATNNEAEYEGLIDGLKAVSKWKPDRLDIERGTSPDTIVLLKKAGYPIGEAKPVVGARVEGILIDSGWLQGGHDERGAGKAAGY